MKLSELTDTLLRHPDAGLGIVLPNGTQVPAHFHVTEVGRVRKEFIDCGGTVRSAEACVLQAWVADDVDHRLTAGKLQQIIALASPILKDASLPVEVEYDIGAAARFAVAEAKASRVDGGGDDRVVLQLAGKHTACLAPDRCGIPGGESQGQSGGESGGDGVADSGCCAPSPVVSLGMGSDAASVDASDGKPGSGCC